MVKILAFLLSVAISANLLAQEEAVVEIVKDSHTLGRGVLIDCNRVLTAYHVVLDRQTGVMRDGLSARFRNGLISPLTFEKGLLENDIATLIVTDVPKDIEVIKVAEFVENVEVYTYDIDWRRKVLPFRHNVKTAYLFDSEAIQGESGTPVIQNKQVIAVVSGGWHWLPGKNLIDGGLMRQRTWPFKAGLIPKDF